MLQQSIERQGTIINETYQYLQRDFSKYAKGAAGMWLLFGCDCDTGDAYRSTYYFFRHVDDVLDGDRSIGEDPFEYTEKVRNSIVTGDFTAPYPILSLASRSIEYLERVKRKSDDPHTEFVQLIDSMVYDRSRMLARTVLDRQALIENYHNQFDPIINLQFILLQSGLRVKDIPDFPEVQARIYSLIDLQKDWDKGLINIPSEVLENAGLSGEVDISEVLSSPIIQQWMKAECIDCSEKLTHIHKTQDAYFSQFVDKKSMPRNERIVQVILNQLLSKIEGYISRN